MNFKREPGLKGEAGIAPRFRRELFSALGKVASRRQRSRRCARRRPLPSERSCRFCVVGSSLPGNLVSNPVRSPFEICGIHKFLSYSDRSSCGTDVESCWAHVLWKLHQLHIRLLKRAGLLNRTPLVSINPKNLFLAISPPLACSARMRHPRLKICFRWGEVMIPRTSRWNKARNSLGRLENRKATNAWRRPRCG